MTLELHPPFAPMEALSVAEIPTGRAWQYEPKWDGFRCVVFRDRGKVELQSKSGRSLTRYFPELVGAILEVKADAFVIDGEIVVPQNGAFSFDALLQRIHPAPSRVKRLAAETPALLIVFDLLAGEDGRSLTHLPLRERRRKLEAFAGRYFRHALRIRLSPATTALSKAKSSSNCTCLTRTSCRTCREKACSCSAASTSHCSTVFGSTSNTRAVPRMPKPSARHAMTRTMSSTEVRLPCKSVPRVSRK